MLNSWSGFVQLEWRGYERSGGLCGRDWILSCCLLPRFFSYTHIIYRLLTTYPQTRL